MEATEDCRILSVDASPSHRASAHGVITLRLDRSSSSSFVTAGPLVGWWVGSFLFMVDHTGKSFEPCKALGGSVAPGKFGSSFDDQLEVKREWRITGRFVCSKRIGSVKGEYESTDEPPGPFSWPDNCGHDTQHLRPWIVTNVYNTLSVQDSVRAVPHTRQPRANWPHSCRHPRSRNQYVTTMTTMYTHPQ